MTISSDELISRSSLEFRAVIATYNKPLPSQRWFIHRRAPVSRSPRTMADHPRPDGFVILIDTNSAAPTILHRFQSKKMTTRPQAQENQIKKYPSSCPRHNASNDCELHPWKSSLRPGFVCRPVLRRIFVTVLESDLPTSGNGSVLRSFCSFKSPLMHSAFTGLLAWVSLDLLHMLVGRERAGL